MAPKKDEPSAQTAAPEWATPQKIEGEKDAAEKMKQTIKENEKKVDEQRKKTIKENERKAGVQ
tara:strand:+ start:1862 stop:2050 length:189 start_codon:yes stop_codon:yes gene_type:complete